MASGLTDLRFYQLLTMPLDRALPKLLDRVLAQKKRAVVLAGSIERVDHLNAVLWTFEDDSFLPHGSARDGDADRQPVWLTAEDENPNGADYLFLVDGVRSARLGAFERVFDIFDGSDGAVAAARVRWAAARAAGHTLTYWQQTETGWEKKA